MIKVPESELIAAAKEFNDVKEALKVCREDRLQKRTQRDVASGGGLQCEKQTESLSDRLERSNQQVGASDSVPDYIQVGALLLAVGSGIGAGYCLGDEDCPSSVGFAFLATSVIAAVGEIVFTLID